MPLPSHAFNRIRVQTARMLEIHALLQRELEENLGVESSAQIRHRLAQAVGSLAASMQQLQTFSAGVPENNSPPKKPSENSPSNDLDEIVEAVLKWHMTNETGE